MATSPTSTVATLGVDLASQPRGTAACKIVWEDNEAQVADLIRDVTDGDILSEARSCEAIGIDAPFGWPESFVEFVSQHRGGVTPEIDWHDDATRLQLRLRETDRFVWPEHFPRPPLSVSAEAIAMPAMRCANLLRGLGVTDRAQNGWVYEIYPAVALHVWMGRSRGYKGKAGRRVRQEIVDELQARMPWLEVPSACVDEDDLLDAFVAALVARAAQLGHVHPVPPALSEIASREGWICIPTGELRELQANLP